MTRMSEREWRALTGEPAKRKYNNVIVESEDGRFDSQREYQRWCELKLLLRAGEIRDLHRQVKYPLVVNGVRVCDYIADFVYTTECGDQRGMTTVITLAALVALFAAALALRRLWRAFIRATDSEIEKSLAQFRKRGITFGDRDE